MNGKARHKAKGLEALLTALVVGVLVFSGRMPIYAQADDEPIVLDEDDDVSAIVDQLNTQISRKKEEIEELKAQMSAYQRAIEEKRQEAVSVQNELAIIENKIAKTELDIKAGELETEATELEIGELGRQIEGKSLQMMRQREMLAEFLRSIHQTDQKTAVDLFLTERTLSDFFNDVQFLEQSQRELKSALDAVRGLKEDLERRKAEETAKKKHLEDILAKLEADKTTLSEQKAAQAALGEQIRLSESRYRYELAQLQKEVQQINADIAAAERRLRKTLDAERLRRLSGGADGWQWPVPSGVITTYFHDPEYPFRYVFEHPGLDIRAAQGTPVRAARGGYVGRAKDAGMGYSYVMLIHDGDLSTVYGHVSRIVVQEDTYVEKGDIIAYSGGAPGTRGAGNLTTGSHLHFEIRLGGIPVNPLNYLKL